MTASNTRNLYLFMLDILGTTESEGVILDPQRKEGAVKHGRGDTTLIERAVEPRTALERLVTLPIIFRLGLAAGIR